MILFIEIWFFIGFLVALFEIFRLSKEQTEYTVGDVIELIFCFVLGPVVTVILLMEINRLFGDVVVFKRNKK